MWFIDHGIINKRVRFFPLLLSICILCALITLPSAVSAASIGGELTDIKSHWAETVIQKWVSQGLAKGYGDGRFGPNDSITRAEFVTLLNRIFGYQQKSDKNFPDIKADAWYAAEIAKAYGAGIISGDNNGNMNPEAVISRQEAAVILTRAFSLTGDHIDGVLKYADLDQIAQWALNSVGAMTKKGYVTGRPGNLFAPGANLSRAEAVKMIDNVMGELINAAGTYTRVVPGNMVVSSPGVTLKDTYISGDLYLTEGIGSESIQLIGVEVKGRTIVADGVDVEDLLLGMNTEQDNTQVQPTPKPTGTPGSTTPTIPPGSPPTSNPTTQPNPTQGPTAAPTPTQGVTDTPTAAPTPTQVPTAAPTPTGTTAPTPTRTVTPTPTSTATPTPTSAVTPTPTSTATPTPTSAVTPTPTSTVTPTPTKSATPTPAPTPGQGKVYYIRQDANGVKNGTDWINAWTELPDALERGATYYIAAGTYGAHVFKDPEVGSEFITLKKATVEDHGTDIGWNEAYANGQAIFTADTGPIFTFDSGYYTFDGQTGNGKSGHGIKIYNPNDGTGGGPGTAIRAIKTSRFLTFKHTEIEGCNWREDTTPSTRLLYLIGDVSYFTLRYCYVHESSSQWMYCSKSTDILIEHCYFENCSNGMGLKIFGSSDQMNVVIRYNHFENVYNNNNFIQLGEHHCAKSSGYEIYGNVFAMTDPLAKCTIAIGNCSDSANDNVFIYNNTFVGLVGSGLSFDNVNETNIAANNLWVNCSGNSALKNIKDLNNSRNIYSPNIFVNADEGDYRLAIPLKDGTVLGSAYSTDFDGKIRGEDGEWDYGAYEFRTDDRLHAFFSYETITETLSGYEPFRVNVNSNGTLVPEGCSIVSYAWDWGDGTTSSGSTAAHTFSAGRYTITLTVTDNLNRKDTRKLSVNVIPSKYPNLYLYLPLNGDCEDASEKGMKASGTVIYEQGVIGQAARFDQDTSRSISVNHSNYLDGFEKMTIAFWAKKNSIPKNIPVIHKHVVYRIALTANGIKADLWDTQGKSGSAEARNIVTDTGWHHYAMVYDGSTLKVYVDGVLCATAPFTGVIKRDVTKSIVIGRDPWGDSFDGLMDEIKIYDRELTDDEILTLKNSAKQ